MSLRRVNESGRMIQFLSDIAILLDESPDDEDDDAYSGAKETLQHHNRNVIYGVLSGRSEAYLDNMGVLRYKSDLYSYSIDKQVVTMKYVEDKYDEYLNQRVEVPTELKFTVGGNTSLINDYRLVSTRGNNALIWPKNNNGHAYITIPNTQIFKVVLTVEGGKIVRYDVGKNSVFEFSLVGDIQLDDDLNYQLTNGVAIINILNILHIERPYVNGMINGLVKIMDKKYETHIEQHYGNNVRHGSGIETNNIDGKQYTDEKYYIDGSLEGKAIIYDNFRSRLIRWYKSGTEVSEPIIRDLYTGYYYTCIVSLQKYLLPDIIKEIALYNIPQQKEILELFK